MWKLERKPDKTAKNIRREDWPRLQVRARVEDRRRYTKCFGYLLIIIGTVIGARWSFGREAPVSMVVV
jgi:hypothetical protein